MVTCNTQKSMSNLVPAHFIELTATPFFLSFCYTLAFLSYKHAKAIPNLAIQAWSVLPLGLWLTPSQYLGINTKLIFSDTFLDYCRKSSTPTLPPTATPILGISSYSYYLLVIYLSVWWSLCLALPELKTPKGRGFNLNTAQSWLLNTCWMGYILHKSETYLGN